MIKVFIKTICEPDATQGPSVFIQSQSPASAARLILNDQSRTIASRPRNWTSSRRPNRSCATYNQIVSDPLHPRVHQASSPYVVVDLQYLLMSRSQAQVHGFDLEIEARQPLYADDSEHQVGPTLSSRRGLAGATSPKKDAGRGSPEFPNSWHIMEDLLKREMVTFRRTRPSHGPVGESEHGRR